MTAYTNDNKPRRRMRLAQLSKLQRRMRKARGPSEFILHANRVDVERMMRNQARFAA